MSLRFEGIGRIGFIAVSALLACSETDPGESNGTGGSASGSAGMSSAGSGTSGAGGGMAGGNTGGSSAGSGTAGSGTAGSAGAGVSGSGGSTSGGGGSGGSGGEKSKTTFFVTSDTVTSGKMGGLDGADTRCQTLAQAAGFGDHTWKAYLSTAAVNAKDRIGDGPWVNSKGVTLAETVAALHAIDGDDDLFLDEKGMKVNGQWTGSPQPNHHDILTGSNADGTVAAGMTCNDWTSDSNDDSAQVGHCDGLGPRQNDMENPDPPYNSWNSVHENQGCGNLTPGGGAGKIYCFASD